MNDLVLERLFSAAYLVLGLSLIAQADRWRAWCVEIVSRPGWPVRFGALPLAVGAVVIVCHNRWTADPGVLLTIAGWWALLKGIVFLLAPDLVERAFGPRQMTLLMMYLKGAIVLVLAGIVGVHAWLLH